VTEESSEASAESPEPQIVDLGLPPSLLSVAFPFYWIANRELLLIQVGPAFQKAAGEVRIGSKISAHFAPIDSVDLDLKSFAKVCVVLSR
jgi:hypothetical protein